MTLLRPIISWGLRRRESLLFSGLQYAQSGLTIVAMFVTAQQMSPAEFGLLSFGIAVAGATTVLSCLAEDKVLVRDLIRARCQDTVMAGSLLARIVIGALSLLLVWGSVTGFGYEAQDKVTLMLCGASGVFFGLTPRAWFDVRNRMSTQSALMLVDRVGFLVGIVWLAATGFLGSASVAAVLLIARASVTCLQWYFVLRQTCFPAFRVVIAEALDQVWSSVAVWAATVVSLVLTIGNQMVIEAVADRVELGIYGLALQFTVVVRLLQNQLVRIVAPSIVKNTHSAGVDRWLLFRRSAWRNVLFSIPLVVAVLGLYPVLVVALLDKTYMRGILPLIVLSIWTLVLGIGIVANQFLVAIGRGRDCLSSSAIAGALSVLLAFPLVRAWGAAGASVALLMAHSSGIACQIAALRRSLLCSK